MARAPSPPVPVRRTVERVIGNKAESFPHAAPYPSDSDSEETHVARPKNRSKFKQTETRRIQKTSDATLSSYRPPFVREATEGTSEMALVPSPGRSRERRPISDDSSESTGSAEDIQPAESHHVQFHEPLVRDAWSADSATSADGWANPMDVQYTW